MTFVHTERNMITQFSRTELILQEEGMERLAAARVAVFGIGGVGGHVVEALARAGVGSFWLFDNDTISLTNLNRQIVALHSTIGRQKTEVMRERILDINPMAYVECFPVFYLPENAGQFDLTQCDYIVDALDTVSAKLELVVRAKEAGIPVISSMGTGNKLNPFLLEAADVYETSVCPLARVMRKELKARGITALKVVYSKEIPIKPQKDSQEETTRRAVPGSVSFVPSCAGLMIAGEVIKDLAFGKCKISERGSKNP